jgi:anti-sigma regulatory factor (Ser/Thr protein kinase)
MEVELRREVSAPKAARALLAQRFAADLSNDDLDTARLLVSELVTNAVVHGRGRIILRADLDDRRLLVEVVDEGPGIEPTIRKGDVANPSNGGRGLIIVDAASSRWGIHKGTAHVWFELARAGPGSSTARCQYTPQRCRHNGPQRLGAGIEAEPAT